MRERDRDQALLMSGGRVGERVLGTRMGTALQDNGVLPQAILVLMLRGGMDIA